MSIAVINHLKKGKVHYLFTVASTVLVIFLCTIFFWWMVDTVVYLKIEILSSPLFSRVEHREILPT
jgi:hypothetical protein